MGGCSWEFSCGGSEGGLVVRGRTAAGRRRRSPRVVVAATAGRGRSATAAVAAAPAAAADLVHLRGGVAQRRADLVDLQLHDGALLALAGLERPLAQPAGD